MHIVAQQHKTSSTIFLHAVIIAVREARWHALLGDPELASPTISVAAGGYATILDGGVAVVTVAGWAVAIHTIVRAAGIAACAITAAAEVLAAGLANLGLALLARELVVAFVAAVCHNHGSAVGIAQRWTVAAQWLVPRMPQGRHDQHSEDGNDHRCPKTCCTWNHCCGWTKQA